LGSGHPFWQGVPVAAELDPICPATAGGLRVAGTRQWR
jgi:hypothetical protein